MRSICLGKASLPAIEGNPISYLYCCWQESGCKGLFHTKAASSSQYGGNIDLEETQIEWEGR